MPDPQMGPDRLVPKGLPAARRGYDRDAVERLLGEARAAWASLAEEHRRLLAEIERAGGLGYLARDLGAVGGDVGRLLGDAQEAARGLRERARSDTAERVASAVVEARRLVAEAEAQAFQLRADAWAAADALLRRAVEAHRSMVAEADAEVLVIRAEAEQEAYRLVSTARREAQDITRGARFEAERTVLELRSQPERILPVEPEPVEPKPAPAEPAPSRARRRRDTAEQPAVHPEQVIRLIQPPGARRLAPGAIDPASYGDALAAEVEALRVTGEVEVVPPAVPVAAAVPAPAKVPEAAEVAAGEGEEPPAEAVPEEPEADEAGPEGGGAAEVEMVPAASAEAEEVAAVAEPPATPKPPGVIDDLFVRLRGGSHRRRGAVRDTAAPSAGDAGDTAPMVEAAPSSTGALGPDALATRERLLLPAQNRALRRAKEAIVELQNVALDSLRVSGAWEASVAAASALAAALGPVAEEGAEAGAAAAGMLTGGEAPAPVITARSDALVRQMAGDLASQVQAAVTVASGAGPLEVAGAVARVFRAWRSDGAERWVRAVAYAAYHDSLLAGLAVAGVKRVAAVPSGLLCPECPAVRGVPWDPAGTPPGGSARPPAHPDCVCTVTVG